MSQLDRIEAQARKLAPEGTKTGGSQLDRIGQLLGAALAQRPSDGPIFLSGTGRLGGQLRAATDDGPPVADPRAEIAAARAALEASRASHTARSPHSAPGLGRDAARAL